MTQIESKTIVQITPEIIAKAFWCMDDIQQAEFFEHLYNEVSKTNGAYSLGEMQWLAMKNQIVKRGEKASKMFLAFSVFAYDFVNQKIRLD